ncbi:hypothetical protein VDGL01_09004 [Verticillium dahliae]
MGFWSGVLNVVGAIPVVGHATAGIQYLAGDKEGAQKSLAASTGNLVSTAGAVGGFIVGGPVGAVAGGMAGSTVGGQIENQINGKGLDLSANKLVTDALMGGAFGMVGGGGVGHAVKGAGTMLGKELGLSALEAVAGSATKTAVTATAGQAIRYDIYCNPLVMLADTFSPRAVSNQAGSPKTLPEPHGVGRHDVPPV